MATYRYFSAAPNRVAPRYGTGGFIGATRTKTGFVVDSEKIVPIPVAEIRANLRAYNGMLRLTPRTGPCLVERTRAEYIKHAVEHGFDPVSDDAYPESESGEANSKNPRRKKSKSETTVTDMFGENGGEE